MIIFPGSIGSQPQDWAGVPIEMDTGEVCWEELTTEPPTAGSDRGLGISPRIWYVYVYVYIICIFPESV